MEHSDYSDRQDRKVRSMSMDIVRRGAVDTKRRSVTIAASDRARTSPEIDLAGLRFDNYRRNPVVMWAHDSTGRSPSGGLPIGRTLSINRTPDGGIVAEFEFLEDDPFAQRIRNAWDKGFLQAASISWLPLEPGPRMAAAYATSALNCWSGLSSPCPPTPTPCASLTAACWIRCSTSSLTPQPSPKSAL